jgi:hypothetical protein
VLDCLIIFSADPLIDGSNTSRGASATEAGPLSERSHFGDAVDSLFVRYRYESWFDTQLVAPYLGIDPICLYKAVGVDGVAVSLRLPGQRTLRRIGIKLNMHCRT